MERLKREGDRSRGEDQEEKVEGGGEGPDRNSYHHTIEASEHTSEEEEEEDGERDLPKRGKVRGGFRRPVEETESMFRPTDFESRLLPPENKPLEMVVLRKAKELVLSHDHQSLARHLLMADCQVQTHTTGIPCETSLCVQTLHNILNIFFLFENNKHFQKRHSTPKTRNIYCYTKKTELQL